MKLPDLVNPMTGNKTKLSAGNIVGMILAAAIGFFAIAQAQNLNNKLSGKFGLDTTVDPLTAERPKVVENFKRFSS